MLMLMFDVDADIDADVDVNFDVNVDVYVVVDVVIVMGAVIVLNIKAIIGFLFKRGYKEIHINFD